jgi:hypothetical protein
MAMLLFLNPYYVVGRNSLLRRIVKRPFDASEDETAIVSYGLMLCRFAVQIFSGGEWLITHVTN